MDFSFCFILFLKGILIGFAVAAPVGPIGILCIRRTLSNHKLLAGLTVLGSACADTFYAAIAAFSLAGIADFIIKHEFYLRGFGGIILAWIGLSIIKNPSFKKTKENEGADTLFHTFSSAFIVTLSNPMTLIVFAAAFTAMGVAPIHQSFTQSLCLVTGVFTGAICWWFSLIVIIYLMQHKLSERQLLWINHFSGAILIGFAAYILMGFTHL